jgi:hypothetical protein
MEINFHDTGQVPLPPEETRILSLSAEPWPDGRHVAVEVEITPFQQRPNLHVCLYDAQGREVASVGAMQILQRRLGFTLHLRQPETSGRYTVQAYLIYPDLEKDPGLVDRAEQAVEVP